MVSPSESPGVETSDISVDAAGGAAENKEAVDGAGDAAEKKVGLSSLFTFAGRTETILFRTGILANIIGGALWPLVYIFLGNAIGTDQTNADMSKFNRIVLQLACTGFGISAFKWITVMTMDTAKENQMARFRSNCVKALVRQDIGWFDVNDPQNLAGATGSAMVLIEDGLSAKSWVPFEFIARFIGSITIGIVRSWKVALICISTSPIYFVSFFGLLKVFIKSQVLTARSYDKAGGVAVEMLSSMRTVAAFGMEKDTMRKYDVYLNEAMDVGVKAAIDKGKRCAF